MKIGVPRERKTLEKRVALTPDGAQKLSAKGHRVLIEKGAGVGADFPDESYQQAGCTILDSLESIWNEAEMVVKVKEPHESEFNFFRPGLLLFDYLHLASLPDVARALLNGKVTALAYELVRGVDGDLPLLEPMSEIAGKLGVLNGSYSLLSQNGGRGMLLGGAIGVPRAIVTIIGAGIAGTAACEMAYGMGANVRVLDLSHSKLEAIQSRFGNQVTLEYSSPTAIARALKNTDLLIGAVLVPGAAAPKIVTREMIKEMPRGSVFVDISVDQGGCGETTRATSLDNPTFVEEGVVHYGVANMPAQTARTSTKALTSATLPYIMEIAEKGGEKALKENNRLREALNTYNGTLTNKEVGEALGIESVSLPSFK